MNRAALMKVSGVIFCALVSTTPAGAQGADTRPAEVWTFDRFDRLGGHPVEVLGNPRVVDTSIGKAVEFDGVDDALFVGVHPLAGAETFTWEAIFRPDGGNREQRWFHLQEAGSQNRMLFEIRVVGDRWFLDSFNFSTTGTATLMNKERLHPVGAWYHVAAVYDGKVFSNYVNGVRQGAAEVQLSPQGPGRSSIGVRINLVDYFKGAIHSARFTRRALSPAEFLDVPAAATAPKPEQNAAGFPPPDSQGGWPTPDRADEVRRAGMDRAKLDDAFDYIKGSSKNGGLLVVRHGWLVYERYFGLGQDLHAYVDEHLARPLGWGRWGFGYRGPGRLERMMGGGGIALRATDMLRFGYLLLRDGRWGDRQVVPAAYVRHAAGRSPYNPHCPYSLQFNVNTGGEIPELPRDAFWKLGSGGHALYVVPSLDLVVWKLGGRDEQYSPANTGMQPHPDAPRTPTEREGWKATVDAETAARRTLQLVIAAVNE